MSTTTRYCMGYPNPTYCYEYDEVNTNITVKSCYCSTNNCNDNTNITDTMGSTYTPFTTHWPSNSTTRNVECWQTYMNDTLTWDEQALGCLSCYITETAYCRFHLHTPKAIIFKLNDFENHIPMSSISATASVVSICVTGKCS